MNEKCKKNWPADSLNDSLIRAMNPILEDDDETEEEDVSRDD